MVESYTKTIIVSGIPHGLETDGKALGIAELASLANLGAPGYGVPSGIRPLNARPSCHDEPRSSQTHANQVQFGRHRRQYAGAEVTPAGSELAWKANQRIVLEN